MRAFFVEAHHLQIAGAADHLKFAVITGHALHRVVDAQRTRPAMNRRLPPATADHLDVTPARFRFQAHFCDPLDRRQHRFTQRLGHGRLFERQAVRSVLRIGRIECNTPDIR